MSEENELNTLMKADINNLAANFYKLAGRKYMPDLDFSASTHPEEYGLWNQAVVAFAYIKKDDWFLQFQIRNSIF